MINKIVIRALEDVRVSVTFQTYKGKEDTYITFFTYLDKSEQYADDEELITGYYVQIDVWSKGDYTDLVNKVHNRMKKVGFIKLNFYDMYENDLKIYHKVMRYRIDKEAE